MGAGDRASTTRKATVPSTPTVSDASTAGAVHPPAGPSMRAYATPARDTVASTAPATSMRPVADGSCDSGTWRAETSRTTTPRGMLMRKIQRHEAAVIRYPPSRGPAAVATPPRPDQAPMASLRSSRANEASRMARLPGVSSAPPTPWSTRSTMSSVEPEDRAQAAEASENQVTPMTNTRRRP